MAEVDLEKKIENDVEISLDEENRLNETEEISSFP